MSNVLQHQHQSRPSAYDIMQNLKERFGDQNRIVRQTAMKELMNTTMIGGTLVRDHVLKMIGFLNELEILGDEIDGETQLSYSLEELVKELQVAEGLIRKPTVAFVTEKGSSSRPKGRKKQTKVKKPQGAPPVVRGPQEGVKKLKGKCFH
ncbi:uncharacterized protein LOC131153774 [Malania oleifera]|uniref:uncharacterized protein LOC131153774 n=1 Tax=Malania oleifera TaxID=397392 RepID=UPI0025ADBF74|nr:uncharacterized protein LOC131153774 [Malania oleifera]